jgi:SNF2 family DNA or RNA helicase
MGRDKTWAFPYSPGAILSLREASVLLPATLVLDQDLQQAQDQIDGQNQAEEATRRLIEAYIRNPSAELAPYQTSALKLPWRHQQISYHWAMRVNCLYLAHKPGLGKSRQYIDIIRGKFDSEQTRPMEQVWFEEAPSIADQLRNLPARWGVVGGVLLVAPSVVLRTLEEEAFEFQGYDVLLIRGDTELKRRRAGTQAMVHVVNYESLESVEGNQYDGLICDEAHWLANGGTLRVRRIQALRAVAKWTVFGSGTPVSNMLPSLFSQYLILDGGRSLGSSEEAFLNKYFVQEHHKWVAKTGAEDQIAQAVSRVTYFLQKKDALPDIPEKIFQVLYLPMQPIQADYYERVRKEAIAEIQTGRVSTAAMHTKLLRLLQICQGHVKDDSGKAIRFPSAKLLALEQMLTGQGDITDRKVIVWCRFLQDIEEVCRMLNKHKVKHLKFQGEGMSKKDRDAIKEAFNSDPQWRVLVGSIHIGIGVNLHARDCTLWERGVWYPDRCSTTVFYGLDYSVTKLEQSMDRTHRGDQVETCLYRFLLSTLDEAGKEPDEARQPIDVKVYKSLQTKLFVANSFIDEGKNYWMRLLGMGPEGLDKAP